MNTPYNTFKGFIGDFLSKTFLKQIKFELVKLCINRTQVKK